jgi:predicted porin
MRLGHQVLFICLGNYMKKSLVFLAALAAVGTASAQSNVTVYGQVDLGLRQTSGSTSNGVAVVKGGNDTLQMDKNHSSRFGFKGEEDLGGGLKASFQLESQFLADTGALKTSTLMFERQANVGLSGGFGTVKFGRTKGLVDDIAGWPLTDPFNNDGVVGDTTTTVVRAGVSQSRVSNAITYFSPAFSGFKAQAQYILSEVKDLDAGAEFALLYEDGPFAMHAAYERPVQTAAGATPTAAEMGTKPEIFTFGGGYTFGAAKVTAAYFSGDPKKYLAPGSVDPGLGKNKGFLIGLNYAIGGGDAKFVYASSKNDKYDLAKVFGIGYDYHLSKRTDVYAYLGKSDLPTVADITKAASVNAYQFGVSHKF